MAHPNTIQHTLRHTNNQPNPHAHSCVETGSRPFHSSSALTTSSFLLLTVTQWSPIHIVEIFDQSNISIRDTMPISARKQTKHSSTSSIPFTSFDHVSHYTHKSFCWFLWLTSKSTHHPQKTVWSTSIHQMIAHPSSMLILIVHVSAFVSAP